MAAWISLHSGSPPRSCRESIHTSWSSSASASRSSRTKPSSAELWERNRRANRKEPERGQGSQGFLSPRGAVSSALL